MFLRSVQHATAGIVLCGLFTGCAQANSHNEAPIAETSATAITAPALIDLEMTVLKEGVELPRFRVDAGWPQMPADTIIGQVPGLSVDKNDTVWLAHRPQSLTGTDTGLAQSPPIALCCKPGPSIMKFAADGRYLGGWGGPEVAPTLDGVNQWPANLHGLYVDDDMTVWLAGNGDGDHVVLNFTEDGDFIRQIGTREETDGNDSETELGNPADIHASHSGIIIADGYINKRIIRFDPDTLSYDGLWGAYGAGPSGGTRQGAFDQSQATSNADGGANPASESFGDIVHCVVGDENAYVYVCDRRNNRAQVFKTNDEGGLDFVKDIVIAPETGGTRTVSDIDFSPDGKFLYIADMMNSVIWILDRETHEPLAHIGRVGRYPGQFTWLHSVVADSAGNLYTSEVGTGRRVQKLAFMGVE